MWTQEASNQSLTSFRQRLFAEFMASEDEKNHELYKDEKMKLFSHLTGKVLELGPGTGVNLRFLKREVKWIGVEPNIAMYPYIMEKANQLGIEIQLCKNLEKDARIQKQGFDVVISTLVLCSVVNVSDTLEEVLRMLKPGGKFVFIEHVVDQSKSLRYWIQKGLPYTPWRYLSCGCNPGRDIGAEINNVGFSQVSWKFYYREGKGIIRSLTRPHICGVATK